MTPRWVIYPTTTQPVDFDVVQEGALALAQATIQNAMDEASLSRAGLARLMKRPPSFVSRMLSGSHNMTVKTMALALAACGCQLAFERQPLQWRLAESRLQPWASEREASAEDQYSMVG